MSARDNTSTDLVSAAAVVSICICTFRRPDGLRAAIEGVRAQVGCQTLEVIVVDNDSAGSARWIEEEIVPNFPVPLRYFLEERSGVGHARNRAVLEARGEWIAFVDDDEIAAPNWLAELWRQREESDADGVFGPVLASLPSEGVPEWLVSSGFYERRRNISGARMKWQDCASGNVLFRRQLFSEVNGFDPAFASTGAEDTDFFWRCLDVNARFVWCDTAIARETIPQQRLTRKWILRRSFLGGHNYARLRARRIGRLSYLNDAIRGSIALLTFGGLYFGAAAFGVSGAVLYLCKAAVGLGKLSAPFPVKTVYGTTTPRTERIFSSGKK